MWMLLSSLAFGGYGDAVDGRPSHIEREVHFWTNMVRIDPSYFSSDYPCSFNAFASSEKTPKWPLLWDHGLGEAARVHSADMNDRDYFSHDTQGGPSFSQRVWSYYDGGAIGENIAWGYSSAWDAVIGGWMCSSGHRSNIMATSFDEMGTGVAGTYYTQDFGGGNPETRALAMGIHLPENPGSEVDFGVDWTMDTAPDAIFVVLDGKAHDLELFIGETDGWSGWSTRLPIGGGCHEYYFVGESGSLVQTFPQDGSYTFGGCNDDDAGAGWINGQLDWESDSTTDTEPAGDDDDDVPTGDDDDDDGGDDDVEEDFNVERSSGGCSTAGVSGGSLGRMALLLVGMRRR